MRTYRYLHFDVFTDRPFTGNQLAVLPDAAGLSAEEMQRIAKEMAFSETTFVLPAEAAGTEARVRIFTPGMELPMAGHPTIGTTYALAHERRLTPLHPTVVLGLGVGPTTVRLEWESTRLRFAWMTQSVPTFGAILADAKGLAKALALEPADICDDALPAQVLSSGVPFLFVPLVSRRVVDRIVVDPTALSACYGAADMADLPIFAFSLEAAGDDATVYSRMFAPSLGVVEDPATGGASGPLGAYLVHHGAVTAQQAAHLVNLQGMKMGRPSRIHISIGTRDGRIETVSVGGQSVLIAEGTLYV
ncbi:MAG: PhzF family phenazine biosynthesis protein [Steroidobacteraceae bacterium]